MKINWTFIRQNAVFQLVLFAVVLALMFWINLGPGGQHIGQDDQHIPPSQFAKLFFKTPYSCMENAEGMGFRINHPQYRDPLYDYWLCFDCNTKPLLKDANDYSIGGDQIMLTDFFMKRFQDKSLSLMHSPDVEILRRVDANGEGRWLLHNRNTNRYFFRCQYVRYGSDL